MRTPPLARLDARVPLVLLFAYTAAVVTTPVRQWPAFVIYGGLFAAAAAVGGASAGALGKRLWPLLPLIGGAALFLPFHTPPEGFSRMEFLANLAARSILGAGMAAVVTSTLPFPRLLEALERLCAPRLAVLLLSFTHRYLFVLADEARRMLRARDSRCHRPAGLRDARLAGQIAGTLFLRGYERGERVHLAMLSRGFSGALPPRRAVPRLSGADIAALAATGALLAAAWAGAHFWR